MRAMEMAVLALTAKVSYSGGCKSWQTSRQAWEPSGEPCRLWNRGSCTYLRCRHSLVCSACVESHPAHSCPVQGPQPGQALQHCPSLRGLASSSQGVLRPYKQLLVQQSMGQGISVRRVGYGRQLEVTDMLCFTSKMGILDHERGTVKLL